MTDGSGAVVSSITRDPWGNAILLAGTAAIQLGYPGQWHDSTSGLYQNWNRDYDPTLGRYIETDPIGLAGGTNLYAYVGGNPINAVDPEGLRPLTSHEKGLLSPFIPRVDLDNADIRLGEMPFFAPDFADGMTIYNTIFVRDPNRNFCSPDDIAFLAHELVHVRQFRMGMNPEGYLARGWWHGYRNNPYEVEAYNMQSVVRKVLNNRDCSCTSSK